MADGAADLRRVAVAHRWLSWVILALILVWVAAGLMPMPSTNALARVSIGLVVALIALHVVAIVLVCRVVLALGEGSEACVMYTVLLLVPCANLIVLAVVNERAVRAMKERGVRVGLMGVPRGQMALLEGGRCRGCGYDMRGLDGARCPECGVECPLAYRGA